MIIWGQADPHFGPEWGERLHREIPGAKRLEIIPATRHLVMEEQPEKFAALLLIFYRTGERTTANERKAKHFQRSILDRGTTLFLMGRIAFRRGDAELMVTMLYGLFVWLVVEALFSLYPGVFFNVGVDIAVFALFSIPLVMDIRYIKRNRKQKPKNSDSEMIRH
jgi:hypothetical protein